MNFRERKENIRDFCSKYGLTDKNWVKIWKRKLKDF